MRAVREEGKEGWKEGEREHFLKNREKRTKRNILSSAKRASLRKRRNI